jgi:DNA-directed RNA polymerase subunit RPC12/RpoP
MNKNDFEYHYRMGIAQVNWNKINTLIGCTGTNQHVDARLWTSSGGVPISDPYGLYIDDYPYANHTSNSKIMKYRCLRCRNMFLINLENIKTIISLGCPSCGSSDVEEL